MKKILSLIAVAAATLAFATNSHAQLKVGVGYGLESQASKLVVGDEVERDSEGLSGFYVNASYNWDFLSKNWGTLSLQPGLTYSFYGDGDVDKKSIAGIETVAKESWREHYLDIPVLVNYSYDLMPGTLKLSAFAGPVFSLGLASAQIAKIQAGDDWTTTRLNMYNGSSTVKGSMNGEKMDETIKGDGTDYGMFDLKLGIGVAATVFDRFDVRVAYNIGLLNRMGSKTDDIKSSLHTNVFQVGVAYNF